MALFVRKIETQKWIQNDILNGEDISADAITGCLRTKNNTLSFWYIESDEQIHDAVLAIVSGFEKAETIDVVTIEPELFNQNDLTCLSTEGLTPYEKFKNKHYDLTDLTYPKLGVVAKIIVECIRQDRNKKIPRKEIKEMILASLKNGEINKEKLNEKLIKDLKIA